MNVGTSRILAACLAVASPVFAAIDLNGDGHSDVWEILYNAQGLEGLIDSDGDGVSNVDEQRAGTNPFDANDALSLDVLGGMDAICWDTSPGKHYILEQNPSFPMSHWSVLLSFQASGEIAVTDLAGVATNEGILRLRAGDLDTDGDGLSDWEEIMIDFDPAKDHTQNYPQDDYTRVAGGLVTPSSVLLVGIDTNTSESWPDPGIIAVRRSGGIHPLAVTVTLAGTASPGLDYVPPTNLVAILEPGRREAWLRFTPLADAQVETTETIQVSIVPSADFVVSGPATASVQIADHQPGDGPTAKEASRFLVQASFGPNTSSVAEVMQAGISNWIDQQLSLPPTFHKPDLDARTNAMLATYQQHRISSWWKRAMQADDQLRQRMAFALSEIFVVSQNSALEGEPLALAAYYDMLVEHAFDNYYDLLFAVSSHPVMGIYLSHLQNEKTPEDGSAFPDENYAREVMQLFSIGLWMLNEDGTQMTDTNNQPIPTYDNDDITAMARVFTGLSYGTGDTNLWWEFYWPPRYDATVPMAMWEMFHDTNTKHLVNGGFIPAGQPGMRDVQMAVSNLYLHPNTGPFIGRQLIQRFVTSNPTTGYVARVAAAFNDNGSGVRGDLGTVLRAILLDPEARDPSFMEIPTYGKMREPYLRIVNLARALETPPAQHNGEYDIWYLGYGYQQEPLVSPSVFNFFQPTYQPPGEIKEQGLVAPEFQITTAVTSTEVPNHHYYAVVNSVNYWPTSDTEAVRFDYTPYLALAGNPDALVSALDRTLTYGTLSPEEHQVIREAVERYHVSLTTNRVRLAVYLLSTSPEFVIQQ